MNKAEIILAKKIKDNKKNKENNNILHLRNGREKDLKSVI